MLTIIDSCMCFTRVCIFRSWHCGHVDLSFFGVWPSTLPLII